MKVVSALNIKGRGVVAVVEDLPKRGLVPGVLVHQGSHAWRVTGIEHVSPPRTDGTVGLCLRAEPNCPEAPEPGALEL